MFHENRGSTQAESDLQGELVEVAFASAWHATDKENWKAGVLGVKSRVEYVVGVMITQEISEKCVPRGPCSWSL